MLSKTEHAEKTSQLTPDTDDSKWNPLILIVSPYRILFWEQCIGHVASYDGQWSIASIFLKSEKSSFIKTHLSYIRV